MTPYDFSCRECKATPDRPCRDAKGRPVMVHYPRIEAFRVVADEPLPERGEDQARVTLVPFKPMADATMRADRRERRVCLASENHGVVWKGGRCKSCWDKHRAWQREFQERMKQKRKAG